MQVAGAAAFAAPRGGAATMPAPRFEGKDSPKICLAIGDAGGFGQGGAPGATPGGASMSPQEAAARRIKQLGVNYVLSGGPPIPWEEERLKALMDAPKAYGLTVGNLMIQGFNNAIYGRTGRDEDIEKVIQSIRAAGKVGLPVIEYNWYAHRAMEGYFEETDDVRTGAGWTGFDYELVRTPGRAYTGVARPEEAGIKFKDLPPLPNEGAHTLEEMWANIAYFLKRVIPEAEKAGVRLALHPNDPPAPISRGSQQIMGTVEGWKRLIEIVKSPANGITFDCGVTREMGHDPVEAAAYFAARDRINHVHFRNVRVEKPYERYTEVFIDEGENNMFAVMKALVKHKYARLIYPEHPRALDYDRERGRIGGYPGGGGYASFAFQVGYTRAMLQAALTSS
ncbi:MAG: mannonate dehydratase [Bryobacteraceae bacterium]|jgi:mannonate dehydratase